MTAAPGFSVDVGGGDPLEIGGWDQLENLAEDVKRKQFDEQMDYASMYRQCFSTNAGRFVLKDLIELYLKQAIITGDDEPGSLSPGIRQGQANIVKRVLYMIEFANTGGGKQTGAGVQSEE